MRFHGFALLILLGISLCLLPACSDSGSADPILTEPSRNQIASGHSLWGMFAVRIDLESGDVMFEPFRAGSIHYNVTHWLMPPYCNDCFTIHVINLDWDNHVVTADVTLKNFTASLTGYDVRGIVYPIGDYILENAYAYTLLYAPVGVLDPSGFRAYKKDDPDRTLEPQESATETYVIGFPEGAGFIDMRFAVDACWPDHCPEAYDIYDFEQEDLDVTPGSSATVTVQVSDWQENVQKVTIDTGALGGTELDLSWVSGDEWTGIVTNELGMPPGSYPCMITSKDEITLKNLFQWVDVVVIDVSDIYPPTWDSEEGIIDVAAGLGGILIWFGTASDPNDPVTYNLYWVEGGTLDFGTANKVLVEESPYLLTGLNAGLHTLCLRAEDDLGNETTNVDFESTVVGEHPNVWWVDGPNMETPRGYAGGIFDNGFFWVLGGSATGTTLDAVEKYDITDGTWSSPWTLIEPRDSFGCGTLDGMGYIFGGRLSETNVTDTCHIVDLSSGSFLLSPPTYPMKLANMGCALLDGTFYLAGGRYFTGSSWTFHREAFSFTPPGPDFVGETDMEYDTSTMGFAAGDTYLMTCGGHPDRDDVLYHVPGTKSWQFKASLTPGRDGNVSVWVDGWLYSLGGNVGPNIIANVDVMDVAGDTWYSINPLSQARGVAVAATDDEYIYIAGGVSTVTPIQTPLASFEIGRIY